MPASNKPTRRSAFGGPLQEAGGGMVGNFRRPCGMAGDAVRRWREGGEKANQRAVLLLALMLRIGQIACFGDNQLISRMSLKLILTFAPGSILRSSINLRWRPTPRLLTHGSKSDCASCSFFKMPSTRAAVGNHWRFMARRARQISLGTSARAGSWRSHAFSIYVSLYFRFEHV